MNTQQELFFTASDGAQIFYRYRPAKNPQNSSENKALVLFHRGHEHSERMMFVHDELALDDFACFAWDARGHGRTAGARGDSPSIGRSVADVQEFIQHIEKKHQISSENLAIIAQSVGAVLVAGWLHDYAPTVRCAILASPAFEVKLYVPLARPALRLAYRLRGNFFVNSYVKAHYLSHNPERQASYDADPLIAKAISVRILLGLYDLSRRVVQDAQAITTPIQLLVSGSDFVVFQKPQHDFYNRLGSHIKERHVLKGFYHDTLGETQRELAFAPMRRFIQERFAQDVQVVDVTQNHIYGFSRQEADELATPLSPYTPCGAYWALQRALIGLGAKWSYGLKMGQITGFDSGSTLDYVYKNQAQGKNWLGEKIDRIYLNAVGWRGIRQRKVHIGQAIGVAMHKLRSSKKKVHVLDIASGHGRYILDALTQDSLPDSVRLRDYSALNVQAGQKLIEERGLQDIVSYEELNAYDRDNYKKLKPRPTLGIVSGLHELFGDNDLILQSLKGFGETIAKGGYLIYTNQPYHPQLEYIARTLTSHQDGKNWVMRRRSQLEMDQLVAKAGFKKIQQWIDEDGIFTVSLAVKGEENLPSEEKDDDGDLPSQTPKNLVNW